MASPDFSSSLAPTMARHPLDPLILILDHALRTVASRHHAERPCPAPESAPPVLDAAARAEAGALMRVNHVGEVCAQALYQAQALGTRDPGLRRHFERAAREETDHLAWCEARLEQLGDRPSRLNPLWYAGAFAIGWAAARAGDPVSLGFVVETERQVEAHLASHLDRLPAEDTASRAIVAQMQADEGRHAREAESAGARPLPAWVRHAMRTAARVMTSTAHRV